MCYESCAICCVKNYYHYYYYYYYVLLYNDNRKLIINKWHHNWVFVLFLVFGLLLLLFFLGGGKFKKKKCWGVGVGWKVFYNILKHLKYFPSHTQLNQLKCLTIFSNFTLDFCSDPFWELH